jgi:hypothetical protein
MHVMGYNVAAVLVAAVATMIVGFLWYSPMMFSKPWCEAMGIDLNDKAKMEEMKKSVGPMYGLAFLATLLAAAVLLKFLTVMGIMSPLYGMKVAFAAWLGFVATVQFTDMLFTRKPLKLFLINTGYQLVCYLVMGAILAVWR